MPEMVAQCPKCLSAEVEPMNDKLWHCRSCGLDFQEAMVQQPAPKSKRKEEK